MNAAPDRTAAMQQAKDERRKRLERAVADVMEEGHTFTAARRNRSVPDAPLREALVAAGWRPRGTQLSQRRSDNQT